MFGISNLLVSALALLTPLLAEVDVWCVILVRLLQVGLTLLRTQSQVSLQGSLESFAFPSLHTMVSRWVPEDERSAFISFAYVGGTFGSVITNPMCGLIIAHLGWEVAVLTVSSPTSTNFLGRLLRDGRPLSGLVSPLADPRQ